MADGRGGPYTLVSFLGVNNLCSLNPNDVKANILTPVLQNGPVLLQASDFNLQTANTNSQDIAAEIDGKIVKLAWHQVCASIFNKLCPNYSNQPQAAIEHIRQSCVDGDGNIVCTSVFAYYQPMVNAMRSFAGEAQFPKSVCNALIDSLDKRLVAIFRQNYADHTILHDLNASSQRRHFPEILQAMQSAEEEVQLITAIARSSVSSRQVFPIHGPTFPSQVERTLERYKSGGGYNSDASGGRSDGYCLDRSHGSSRGRRLGRRDARFGYKSPNHPWIHGGVIVCSNANAPGVHTEAARVFEEWRKKSKSKREQRKRNRSVDYNTLSERNKEKGKEAVLASLASDDTICSSPATTPSGSYKKPMILVSNDVVLSSASPTRAILPAPIVSNFPHIHLQLGTVLNCPNCPVIRCVVNTAAALSTGNFHLLAAVAKQYPHCVPKLFVPKDYNPIVLSGIVQCGSESVTKELMVGFQFHLPYFTKEGDTTSILIAIGPHVTVNTIVSLPFIQATHAVIDLTNNVAELCALDAPPFPLEYHCATVHVPIVDEANEHPVHMADAYSNLIAEINSLERHFTSANLVQVGSDGVDGTRSVCFGAHPIGTSHILQTTLQPALTHSTKTGKSRFVGDPMDHYNDPDMGIGFDHQ